MKLRILICDCASFLKGSEWCYTTSPIDSHLNKTKGYLEVGEVEFQIPSDTVDKAREIAGVELDETIAMFKHKLKMAEAAKREFLAIEHVECDA